MGIGLSLVKNLVEMHGGSITAHSQGPGMGSEFVVRLPVLSGTQAHEVDSPKPVLSDAPEVLPCRRILIVDDNAVAADGLGRLLALVFGQEVRVVYDGPSALDMAGSFQPEVVLLDLGMAVMDGYEVASAGATGMRRGADRGCDGVGPGGGSASLPGSGVRPSLGQASECGRLEGIAHQGQRELWAILAIWAVAHPG